MEPNVVPIQPPEPAQQSIESNPLPIKKSLPKWPLIIVGIILLATLLTGTYLLGKNQGINQKQAITIPAPTQTVIKTTPTTDIAQDVTTDWKTYTNSFFAFTFKYPQDWKILDQKSTDNYNDGVKRNLRYDFTRLGIANNDIDLNIELTENPFISPAPIEASSKIQLSDTAASLSTRFEEGPMPARGYWTWLSFVKDGKEYSIYLVSPEKDGSQEQLMKSIIFTFKFIDQTASEVCPASGMALDKAETIAQNSECSQQGTLLKTHMCNPNGTGYWWIDFKPNTPKSGCNPACVVDVANKNAEINWRCTGFKQ